MFGLCSFYFFIYKGRNLARLGPLFHLAAIGCSHRTALCSGWGMCPPACNKLTPPAALTWPESFFMCGSCWVPQTCLHLECCPVQSVCNICVLGPIFPCVYTGCCFVISVLKLILHVPFHPGILETWGSVWGCITWVLHICDLYVFFPQPSSPP